MPKLVDHDKYRQELLEGSFDCFARHGYAALTMRDLAKNLGVSTGTLYHYFKSKEELFEGLIDYLTTHDLGLAAQLTLVKGDVEERIVALFALIDEHKDYFLKEICVWVDFYRHSGDEVVTTNVAVQRASTKYREWMMQYLNITDSDLLTMLSCLVNGLILELMGPREHISFERQARLFAVMLKNHK